MNIYFHIDELSRDAVVASALKKKLHVKGHTLVYGNRVLNRLLRRFHKCFDVIIVPRPHFLYDNWGDDWMSWNTRIVTLSAESLGIICKDHHVMARTLLENRYFEGERAYIDRIDAFCFWGEKQLKAIKDYAPEVVEKCNVVGHPRHDRDCLPGPEQKVQSLKKNGKQVGVITRAVMLNDYFGRTAIESFSTLFDDHFQYEYFNRSTGEKLTSKRPGAKPTENLIVQAIDVENTLRVARKLTESGHKVSLRVHPKERIDEWKNLLSRCGIDVEFCDPKIPVASWLEGLEFVIGPPSTCFYDAVMLGKTPVCTARLDGRREAYIGELWEDNNRLMEHIFKPETLDELVDYVGRNHVNTSDDIKRILKEEADFPNCANSLDKVVEVCLSVGKGGAVKGRSLIVYYIVRYVFIRLWRIKNFLVGRRENSAMFALGKREVRFIDSLSYKRG